MAQQGEQEQPLGQNRQQQPPLGYRQLCLPEAFADGDIAIWIRRFDICAAANRWGDDDKLLRLPTLLQGRAFAVYERLAADQKDTYARLTNSLERAFEPHTEERKRLATRQFAARSLQPGEDLEVFLRDLELLLDRAQPGLPRGLREQQLVDRFIAGLPESLGDQLYVLAPQGLNGTVSKARELVLLQQRSTQRRGQGRVTAAVSASAASPSVEQNLVRSLELRY